MKKALTQNCNNLLSQRTPQTVTSILPNITPFADIGKLFMATVHKNWHTIASDTTLSTIANPLAIQILISLYQIQQHSQPSHPLCTSIWLLTAEFLTLLPIWTNKDIPTVIYPQLYTHSGYTPPPLLPIRHIQLILVLRTT